MDALSVVFFIAFLGFIVLLIWIEIDSDRIKSKEDKEIHEAIKHLPIDQQVSILSTKSRQDAANDW